MNDTPRHITTGLFNDPEQAAHAVDELRESSVPKDAINVLATEDAARRAFASERSGTDTMDKEGWAFGSGDEGPNAVYAAGFSSAGVMPAGGAALVRNGPLVSDFGGAGVGSPPGGIAGGLMGLGISKQDIDGHEQALGKGAVLLAVDTSKADKKTVREVLSKHHAQYLNDV